MANEFARNLKQLLAGFPNGGFELLVGERITRRARVNGVPNKPGIYVVQLPSTEVVYIGKAGTLRQDGSLKDQGLRERLGAKGRWNGVPVSRNVFWQNVMAAEQADRLTFTWIVTWASRRGVIPAKAEADLLQAFFADADRFPKHNAAV